MHLEFKSCLVSELTRKHFESAVVPYKETLHELLAESHSITGCSAIMHKKKVYYPEMITDTDRLYEHSREMSGAVPSIIPQLEAFDEDIKIFNSDRKKFYAFMRKIVNVCRTITDIKALIPENYLGTVQAVQDLLNDRDDYPVLTYEEIDEFKKVNDLSYRFLQEQSIWDSLGV